MDEKISVQKYFEDLVQKLGEAVRENIEEDVNFKEMFFADLTRKIQNLMSMLPGNAQNLESLLVEIYDYVKAQEKLAIERNEIYYNSPIAIGINELIESQMEEILGAEDLERVTREIALKMQGHLEDKETTRPYRGKAVENGYLKDFMEQLDDAFKDLQKQGVFSLSQEDAYDFIRIVKNMQMEIGEFVAQAGKQNQSIQNVLEEVVSKYMGDVIGKVSLDRAPEGEKQEAKPEEMNEGQNNAVQANETPSDSSVVLEEEKLSPEKRALIEKIREAERRIDEERNKEIIALKEMIALESQLYNMDLSPIELDAYTNVIVAAKAMLMQLESTIGKGIFTGEEIKAEPAKELQQQDNNPIFTPNDIPVYQRDEMMQHLRLQDLPQMQINEKDCYIVSSPITDPETGDITKRGVIWTATAYQRACNDIMGKSELFCHVEEKTETCMTLDEAIELGLYDDRKRKQKETSKNEYDDYSPFDAG